MTQAHQVAPWIPDDYVLRGRFSRPKDLRRVLASIVEVAGAPVALVTYSGRFVLPSISGFAHPPELTGLPVANELIDKVRSDVEESLRKASDREAHLAEALLSRLSEVGLRDHTLFHFGRASERTGDLAVVVAIQRSVVPEEVARLSKLAALCALASRSAHFHRENSQDLAVRRAFDQASGELETDTARTEDDLASVARSIAVARLQAVMQSALDLLDVDAIAVYDLDESDLRLVTHAESVASPPLTDPVPIDPDAARPIAPELGGSVFDDLGELVNLAWTSSRKLFGSMRRDGQTWHAVAIQFGGGRGLERVAGVGGVVLLTWQDRPLSPLGTHELSQIHSVVRYAERVLADQASSWSVGTVGAELRRISNSHHGDEGQEVPAGRLPKRRDIRNASPTIEAVLSFLVSYTRSLSATCRILTGDVGDVFHRSLIRVDAMGEGSGDASPEEISLGDHRTSVNAWVAVNGEPVHLRNIVTEDDGSIWIDDLRRYPGLDEVKIFRDTRAELCVPIFAEGRLVGTVNLEASRPWAYDATAEVVAECAHVIGVALLESRRHIGVELMIDAGGFLDRRHELDKLVRDLGERMGPFVQGGQEASEEFERRIAAIRTHIYVPPRYAYHGGPGTFTVGEVIRRAMHRVSWTFATVPLEQLVEGDKQDFLEIAQRRVEREQADALTFALCQALTNTQVHGKGVRPFRPWTIPIRLHASVARVGGQDNLYLGMASLASESSLRSINTDHIFREPIERKDGTSRMGMGTYIAGEVLRRCSGSAYFRTSVHESKILRVTVEFSIPLLDDDPDPDRS